MLEIHPIRTVVAAALVLGLAAVAACGPSEEAGPGEAPEAEAVESAPGPLAAELWVDDLRLGSAVEPEGAIPQARQTDTFAPGDDVYVSMAVADAPAGSAVHAIFRGPDGEAVAEDEKKVPAGAHYLYFDAGDTADWQPGAYRVEVRVDGQMVKEAELTVTDRPREPLGEPG